MQTPKHAHIQTCKNTVCPTFRLPNLRQGLRTGKQREHYKLNAPSLSWVTRRSQSGNPPASTVSPARFRFRPFPGPPAGSKKNPCQSPWYHFFTLNPNLISVSSNSQKTYIGLKRFFRDFQRLPGPVRGSQRNARPTEGTEISR